MVNKFLKITTIVFLAALTACESRDDPTKLHKQLMKTTKDFNSASAEGQPTDEFLKQANSLKKRIIKLGRAGDPLACVYSATISFGRFKTELDEVDKTTGEERKKVLLKSRDYLEEVLNFSVCSLEDESVIPSGYVSDLKKWRDRIPDELKKLDRLIASSMSDSKSGTAGSPYVKAGGFICDRSHEVMGNRQLRQAGSPVAFRGCIQIGENLRVNVLNEDQNFGAVMVGNAGGIGWVDAEDLIFQ